MGSVFMMMNRKYHCACCIESVSRYGCFCVLGTICIPNTLAWIISGFPAVVLTSLASCTSLRRVHTRAKCNTWTGTRAMTSPALGHTGFCVATTSTRLTFDRSGRRGRDEYVVHTHTLATTRGRVYCSGFLFNNRSRLCACIILLIYTRMCSDLCVGVVTHQPIGFERMLLQIYFEDLYIYMSKLVSLANVPCHRAHADAGADVGGPLSHWTRSLAAKLCVRVSPACMRYARFQINVRGHSPCARLATHSRRGDRTQPQHSSWPNAQGTPIRFGRRLAWSVLVVLNYFRCPTQRSRAAEKRANAEQCGPQHFWHSVDVLSQLMTSWPWVNTFYGMNISSFFSQLKLINCSKVKVTFLKINSCNNVRLKMLM